MCIVQDLDGIFFQDAVQMCLLSLNSYDNYSVAVFSC
jgi:hypothetical protein